VTFSFFFLLACEIIFFLPLSLVQVRFFTRGEFSSEAPSRGFMPPEMGLSDFAVQHRSAAAEIYSEQLSDPAASEVRFIVVF